jgi:hypothetical protein
MPTPNTAYFTASADDTTSQVILNNDWFTVKNITAVNSTNIHYTWIAFSDSNCSSNSSFCVWYYIWDWDTTQNINQI